MSGDFTDAGRDFVKAYVEFVHYAEKLHLDAGGAPHAAEATRAAPSDHHQH